MVLHERIFIADIMLNPSLKSRFYAKG